MAAFVPFHESSILFFRPLSHYPFASAPSQMDRYVYWLSGWFEKALLCIAVSWYACQAALALLVRDLTQIQAVLAPVSGPFKTSR